MNEQQGNVGMAQAKYYDVVIRDNNVSTHRPCGICGQDYKPNCGPELFLEGAFEAVCYPCGKKHAPELSAMLDAHYRAEQKACGCISDDAGEFVMIGVYSFQICREHGKFREYKYYPPPDPLTVVSQNPGAFLALFKGLTPLKAEDGERLLTTIRCPLHAVDAWPQCCGEDFFKF